MNNEKSLSIHHYYKNTKIIRISRIPNVKYNQNDKRIKNH